MSAQVYTTSGVQGAFPNPVSFARNPTSSDKISPNGNNYPIWQTWFNSANGSFWAYGGGGSWSLLGGSSADVNTINNLSPTAGNITIAGTANQITMTSAGSTVTASIPATFTAPGAVTATLGDITAMNGNLILGTAGNKVNVATGADASVGTSGAMVGGAVTVNTTAVSANSLIFAYPAVLGTVTAPQAYYISAIVPATSFTITSADATDTSTWNYFIIN